MSVLDPFVTLLHSALLLLSDVLPGPAGVRVGLGVVLLTLVLRAAMLPLSVKAFRAQQKRSALAPEIAALSKRYGKDRARLTEEVMAAHQRAGTSPIAGMGTLLAQAPVMTTLYRLVTSATVAGQANVIATVSLLGTPLSVHWLPALATGGTGPVLLCVGLFLGLLLVALLQARRQTEGPALLKVLPFGAVAWAGVAPVAFSIYLLTSTTWSLVERSVLPRLAA